MMVPAIRPATDDDRPTFEMAAAILCAANDGLLHRWIDGWPRANDDVALVAEDEGQILGVVWARRLDPGAASSVIPEVSMWVAEGHRGVGIGNRLMAGLFDLARAARISALAAVILPDNNAALALATRHGFVEQQRTERAVTLLAPLSDALHLPPRGSTPGGTLS